MPDALSPYTQPARSLRSELESGPAAILETLIESGPVILFRSDTKTGAFTFLSANVTRILGDEEADILGDPRFWQTRVHPEDWPAFNENWNNLSRASPLQQELRLARSDGEYLWVDLHAILECCSEGNGVAVHGQIVNIHNARVAGEVLQVAFAELEECVRERTAEIAQTNEELRREVRERGEIEKALRQSEARSRALLESTRAVPWELDFATGQFVYVGQEAVALLGYPIEDWKKPGFWARHLYPEDSQIAAEFRNQAVHSLDHYQSTYRMIAADGRIVWVQEIVHVSDTVTGSKRLQGFMIDVTEQRETDEALKSSHRFLQATLDSLSAQIAVLDQDGNIVEVNAGWKHYPGNKIFRSEPNYIAAWDKLASEGSPDAIAIRKNLRDLMAGRLADFRYRYRSNTDGSDRWFVMYGTKFWLSGLLRVIISQTEVTAQMHAEDALRESEERFRQMAESVTDAFFLFSAKTLELLYVNGAYEHIWGYKSNDLYAHPDAWLQSLLPEDRDRVVKIIRNQIANGIPCVEIEFRIPRGDGIRWIEATTSLVRNSAGEISRVVGTARDFTERKETLATLAQLGTVVECSDDAIISSDVTGRVLSWNGGAQKLFGYSASEMRDRPLALLTPRRLDGETEEILRRTKNGQSLEHFETDRVRKDGSEISVSLTVSPLRNDTGEVIGASTIARDITSQKRAEEALAKANETLEARVRERTAELARATEELRIELEERRMAEAALRVAKTEAERANGAKSEFLSRMSHELRTPLNAIIGFGQLLELEPLDKPQRESVEHIQVAGMHLLSLINEVLDIARIEAGHVNMSLEPVGIRDVLDEAFEMVGPEAQRRQVRLERCNDSCGDICVLADRQRLKQVVLNLISNGIKYNRPNGSLRVHCTQTHAGMHRISFSDSGPGISPSGIKQLFAPFQRLEATQGTVEGTGLGLALSKRLVEAMGGSIGVASVLDEGSTFWIDLPTANAPAAEADSPESELPDLGQLSAQTRSIVYIEDNPSNLRLVERIIAKMPNVELVTAVTAADGIETINRTLPNLILLDLDLPDMSGFEVLQRLRLDDLTRKIPVVIVSADATQKQIDRLIDAGARSYLTKPLDIKLFLQVISDVFDS
jgi:PAS domain S-box-containing protein